MEDPSAHLKTKQWPIIRSIIKFLGAFSKIKKSVVASIGIIDSVGSGYMQ